MVLKSTRVAISPSLINNYLGQEIKDIFYPFYIMQNIVLSSKFTIRNNFISTNGRKFNLIVTLFFFVLFFTHGTDCTLI